MKRSMLHGMLLVATAACGIAGVAAPHRGADDDTTAGNSRYEEPEKQDLAGTRTGNGFQFEGGLILAGTRTGNGFISNETPVV